MDFKALLEKIPPKQRIWVGTALALVVGFLYYYFLISPVLEQKAQLQGSLDKVQKELNDVRAVAANKPKLEQQIRTLEAEIAKASAKLPPEKEIPALLTQINTLGQQSGLEFLSFKPATAIRKDFYNEVPVQLRVQGGYHGLGAFFDKLSKMPRIVTVGDIRIITSPKKPEEGSGATILADFNAVTYTFEGAKGSAPAAPQQKKP